MNIGRSGGVSACVCSRDVILLVTLAATAACARASTDVQTAEWARLDRPCPINSPAYSLPAALRDSLPPIPSNSPDDDDRWVQSARTVPGGFGGYFMRADGREGIYLKQPEKRAEAVAALNLRPVTGVMIGSDVVAERGRWDYVQLYEWYRYLRPRIRERGLWSTDLDEARNRILIGVESDASRRRLEAELGTLGVPCFLVAIEIGKPPRTMRLTAPSARDTVAAPQQET